MGAIANPPQQHKIFYGWVIVAVMMAANAVSVAMAGPNFGLFIKPMGEELGIGRSMFGWAQTVRQAVGALTSPTLGRLLDRYGARIVLPVTISLTALGLIGLGLLIHSWQLIVLFGLLGIAGPGGGGLLITLVPIAKWFVRKRGRALAIATLGLSIGGVILIPTTQVLIDTVGWRQTWIILGVLGAVIVIPTALVFLRRQPEDMGLKPDGEIANTSGQDRPPLKAAVEDEASWTLKEALRSLTFWRLTLVFSLVALSQGAVGLHRIPHFMDTGIDSTQIAYATALDAVAAGMTAFIFGHFMDRFPARFLGGAGFLLFALATYLTLTANSTVDVFLAMIAFGVGVGSNIVLQNYLWADYYGRHNLGAIRGVVMPITLVVGGIGGPVAGYVWDATGTYDPIWWIAIGLLITGAIVLATSTRPKKVAIPVARAG